MVVVLAIIVRSPTDDPTGFVGATLVAVGTSLAELATVIQSARRSEADLIVANLLGSNLFNSLAAGGVIDSPMLAGSSLTTIAVLAAIALAGVAAVSMQSGFTVTRRRGIVLVVGNVALVPLLA